MWRSTAGAAVLVAATGVVAVPAGSVSATTAGDNGAIAFVRLGSGHCQDIGTVQPAGTGARTLTNCPQLVADPAFAPSGRQLAVTYIASSGPQRLAVMPATGGRPTVISTGVTPARSPSFDPTGHVLAFGGGDAGGGDTQAIYTVPVTGGTATRLTPAVSGEVNDEPDYAPTGGRIAWARRLGPTYDVWTMTVDATGHNPAGLTDLTNGTGNSRWPSWSPDGQRLAFASDRSGTWQIYVMSATGTDVVQVTTGTGPHIEPTWSPDGTAIAFTTGCTTSSCTTPGPNSQRIDGNLQVADVTDLTHPGLPRTVIATSASEFDPQWGRACSSAQCPAAASLSRSASLASFHHRLRVRGALTSAKSVCLSRVPVVLQYENVIGRGPHWHHNAHWLTEDKGLTTTTGTYRLSLPASLTGWYRVTAPAVRVGEDECASAVTRIRENLTVHDKRGDSRGPVDIAWSWASVRNGVITHTVQTYAPFSSGQLGVPCVLFLAFGRSGNNFGGSIGCFGGVLVQDKHKPVTIRRPNSRTITYSFKMSELGTYFAYYEWVPWSRGTSDSDWYDVAPNDSDLGTESQPNSPPDMPYLFKKKPAYHH